MNCLISVYLVYQSIVLLLMCTDETCFASVISLQGMNSVGFCLKLKKLSFLFQKIIWCCSSTFIYTYIEWIDSFRLQTYISIFTTYLAIVFLGGIHIIVTISTSL